MKQKLLLNNKKNKLNDIYDKKSFNVNEIESKFYIGKISDKEKLIAAKQILLGLAILYIITIMAYLEKPEEASKLLEICTVTFPPIVTLIIAFYFREKNN